ncbi:MAG TPA: hypothetical protein VN207_10125, partial [Ktedonobacteraceae bacterium]|nr:hypothetical protein [Ktedonobacteraceae bacterium]
MAVDSLIALLGLILGVCGLLSLCAGIIYCLFFVAHGLCSIAYTSLLTLSEKEPLPFKPYQVRVLIRTESAVDATQALPPLREKQDNAANALSPVTSSQLRSESDETESLSTNDTTKAVVPDPGLSRVPQPAPVPNAGEERLPEMGPQANITDIPNGLFHATTRNQLAEQIISNYAADHTIMDVVIGAVGLLFPGGGIAAMVASIAAQAPVIYLPMVKELAKVYSASPDRFTSGVVTKATIIGGLADVGSEVVQEYLATEFGQEFLLELLHEMLPELGIGALLALLPVAGGIISAGLDATIAATLTWRVGVTTVLYFLYGEEWLGSKKQTYDQAKALVGPLSPKMENRVRLDSILQQVPQIKEKAIRGLSQKIYFMKKANPSISKDAMLSTFQEEGIPNDLIEEALI